MVFFGWKFIPAYAAALRLNYAVTEYAREGATYRHSAEQVQQRILWEAEHLELPVTPAQVNVDADHSERVVRATVAYQIPIELVVKRAVLNFHASTTQRPDVSAESIKNFREAQHAE